MGEKLTKAHDPKLAESLRLIAASLSKRPPELRGILRIGRAALREATDE